MNNRAVRIAVVGLRHGTEHLDHYQGREDVKIVGLCDQSEEARLKAADKYGVHERALFSDYGQMLRKASPDAVFVMTPVPLHAPMTIQALDAGCHVMVAKSLCESLEEAKAMIAARDRANRHVEVGFQMHHAPIYRYLQDHLNDSEFGDLRSAWIQFFYPSFWRQPGSWQNRMESLGGMLLDCAVHPMDVLLYVLDRPWTRVWADGRQFLDGPPERNTMDAATVLIDLEGGPRLTMDLVDSSAYCHVRAGVVGSTGKFEVEHWAPNGAGHVRFHGDKREIDPVRLYVPSRDASTGHIGIVEQSMYFLEICRGNAKPRSSLESAMETLAAQMAIVRSLREGRWVARREITSEQYRTAETVAADPIRSVKDESRNMAMLT